MARGGSIRAASRIARIGVNQERIVTRYSRLPLPTQHLVGNVSFPGPAFTSSSSQHAKADPPTQQPALEVDNKEFTGRPEEQLPLESPEPLSQQVFGGAPSLEEADTATAELKDVINKICLLSPSHAGADHSGLRLLSKHLETKSCILFYPPKHALAAFSLLNENSQAQSVVASIASDPNVWDAVLKNKSLQEFIKPFQNTDAPVEDFASPSFTELFEDEHEDSSFKTKAADILESSKVVTVEIINAVIDMLNNFSSHLQSIFGFSSMVNTKDTEENSRLSLNDKAVGASFLGLAIMVIIVVVLKRG